MNEILTIGDPPIDVHLRENLRAKRYSLRISNNDGKISLTLPRGANMSEALEFAQNQEGWMRRHLSKRVQPMMVHYGQSILLDGEKYTIEPCNGRSVVIENQKLLVPGNEAQVVGKLRGFYKTLARERFVHASEAFAQKLGKSIGTVSIRDTRSRWGSCTSDGRLMYSWRLVMAPRSVQDYVAAHEVCHLLEMNHSKAYWTLVEGIFPDYKAQRNWLKRNGSLLHQYQL